VKPETALFLEKSHELLERADTMMGVGLTDDAGRAAYLAGLHAAQAFIFETKGRVFKRHSGVQRESSRLVKDDPRVGTGLRAFLSRTYQPKAIADYPIAPVRTCRQRLRARRSEARTVTGNQYERSRGATTFRPARFHDSRPDFPEPSF
jgi:uncharacterized protein (UPF0332 family)